MKETCSDKRIEQMLHAYELGMLSDEQRSEVELHIMDCDSCYRAVSKMAPAARVMRTSELVPSTINRIVLESESGPTQKPSVLVKQWRILAPAFVTIAAILLIVFKDWRFDIKPNEPAFAIENRVAVVPFKNSINPSDTTQLGEILASLLITNLSQTKSLQIVSDQFIYDILSRNASSGKDDKSNSPLKIAQQANARLLITGTISQTTPDLIITTHLIETSTGVIKNSATITSQQNESVFSIVDRLSNEIRKSIFAIETVKQRLEQSVAEITTSSPQAYQEYIRGVDLWRKAYFDDAIPHFEKAITLDSTFAIAYYYLSMLNSSPEKQIFMRYAKRYIGKASERDKFFIQSRSAIIEGNTEEGLNILTAMVSRYPDEKEALLMLGRTLYGLGHIHDALDRVHASIALDASYKEAYALLPYIYSKIGNVDNALQAVDKYIELSPHEANPYDTRAEICALNGRLDQAIESYRKSLNIKPDMYSSVIYLGIMYIFKGDLNTADSCFRVLTQSRLAYLRSSGRLYQCYLPITEGHFSKALETIDRAISEDSADNHPDGIANKVLLKGIVHEALGNRSQAISYTAKSIQIDPSLVASDYSRGFAFYIKLLAQQGENEKANAELSTLKENVENKKRSRLSYISAKGSMFLARNEFDSAIVYFEQAVARSDNFYDHYQLALAYLKAHKLAEAVSRFQKLETTYSSLRSFWQPENILLHYHLGRAYEESNWNSKAIEQYTLFLKLWKTADQQIKEIDDAKARLTGLEAS